MSGLTDRIPSVALAAALFAFPSLGAAQMTPVSDLADLSLEELGNLRVTTASLRPERLLDAPASIFVITPEDIRHSGARSLPEALRLAPNLEVAQVSATTWAVTARGFQNVITNKLLVLLDGRTLYTTVLSGVLWDAQDVMLEDVERIEVISGPGAALFGANAFVGVINIITRSAKATQESVLVAGADSRSQNYSIRHGGKLGDDGAYRIYAMHLERDNLRPPASHVADDFAKTQLGFRTDFGSAANAVTLQGDAYEAKVDGNDAPRVKLSGANLLGRWSGERADGSRLKVQAYYDHTNRDDPAGFKDRMSTVDVETQADMREWGTHRISVGAGYRYALDNSTPTPVVRFIPDDRRLHWASAFAQDEITLTPQISLTAGAKAQTATYVNPEFMPDLRLSWNPSAQEFFWIAASRVARTPGRVDRELFVPGNAPFFIRGGPFFESERGNVFEIGHRAQPTSRLTYSITLFYSQLDDLRGGRLAPGGGAFISNAVEGTSSGIEAWALYQASDRWRITAGLLELRQDLRDKSGNGDLGGPAGLGNDPRHTVKVRSSYRVSDTVDFDVNWRYVSSLAYLTTVPGYQASDVRIAWRPQKSLELSIAGYNIFDRGHVEFDEHGLPAVIPRTAYAQARWTF
jgi:iron complex outermembrane recepter protein